jgi:hypothetical protein
MGPVWVDVYEFCKSVHLAIPILEVCDELRQAVTDCGKEMMVCVAVDFVRCISADGFLKSVGLSQLCVSQPVMRDR